MFLVCFITRGLVFLQDVNCTSWVEDFVRSRGLEYFCDAILSRGLFGDSCPREMTDTQQACLVNDAFEIDGDRVENK